jgi:hypothetical protein
MKSLSMLVLGVIGLAMTGCAAEEGAIPEEASDESEVVGKSSFPAIEKSFDLQAGAADEATLRAGDCYRALVLPVEGIPTHTVKKFKNGAIIAPSDGKPNESVCVDLYGANKISFSHAMLDAVVRLGLGHFDKKVQDPKTPEGVELHFTNGTMRVFTGIPAAKREDNARKTTGEFRPSAAIGVGGTIVDITLKGVDVVNPNAKTKMDIPMSGELVGIAHRYAWNIAVKKSAGSMTNDALGTFTRTVYAEGDAKRIQYGFAMSNSELRYTSVAEANNRTKETLQIYAVSPPMPGEPTLASCTRSFATGGPRPEYSCTGL